DDDKKRSMLLTACGEYLYSLIRTLCQPNKPCDTSFDDVIKVVTNHLKPKPSEIVRRCVFHATSRNTNESIANFANRLRKLAEHCNFGTVLDTSLRDRFVCGINHDRIQRRLLVETTLDFKTAFNIAEEKKWNKKHDKKESSKLETGKCKGCSGSHPRSKCPFLKQKCHSCQKVGHIAKVCRLRTKTQASNKLDECSEENDLFSLQTSKFDNKFLVNLKVGEEVKFEVDTGSARTVISEDTFNAWKEKPKVSRAETTLRTYSGELLKLKGQTSIRVTKGNRQRVITLVIAAGSGPNLLGRDALRQFPEILSELTVNYNSETSETLTELLDKFRDVFEEKKEGSNIEVTLEINENATPKFVKARPVPFAMRKKVEEAIQSLVEKGILEPQVGITNSLCFKTRRSIRICGDYKSMVNPHLRTDIHPMPTFNDLREKLGGNS
ncbi:uncharacterized protein B4U80_10081, partial [Leptotrombidium deliense]